MCAYLAACEVEEVSAVERVNKDGLVVGVVGACREEKVAGQADEIESDLCKRTRRRKRRR